jgi:hypothetical protein
MRARLCLRGTMDSRILNVEPGSEPMQRKRAIAIAIEQKQAFQVRLIVASGMLLSAALLLLLISP